MSERPRRNPRPPNRYGFGRAASGYNPGRHVLPVFTTNINEFEEGRPGGIVRFPILVQLQVAEPAGELVSDARLRLSLVRALRQAIVTAVRTRQPNWTTNYIYTHARGYLQAHNLVTGTVRHHGRNMLVGDITSDLLNEIMLMLETSSNYATLQTIEWHFVVEPISILRGGGKFNGEAVRLTSWGKKGKGMNGQINCTWKEYKLGDDPGTSIPINCAAFAINIAMKYNAQRYSVAVCPGLVKIDAYALQQECGWDTLITIDELEKFTSIYKEYRITCITPLLADHQERTWAGDHWVYDAEDLSKTLYIVYDYNQLHYALCDPEMVMNKTHTLAGNTGANHNYIFCHRCVHAYLRNEEHVCPMAEDGDGPAEPVRKPKQKRPRINMTDPCPACGLLEEHDCPAKQCMHCKTHYLNGDHERLHRCILYEPPEQSKKRVNGFRKERNEQTKDGTEWELFAYDFESAVKLMPVITDGDLTMEFETDEEAGKYVINDEDNSFIVYRRAKAAHVVNTVVAKNVYTNERYIWSGEKALEEFIYFMTIEHNKGYNYCIAHNASGYDNRLLIEGIVRTVGDKSVKVGAIVRGAKFLQVTANKNTHFNDSMLHLRGSLKALGKDFSNGANIVEKGYFPHLFNSEENYDYVGPIPPMRYFDLALVCKNEKDFLDFKAWHASWDGRADWNFMAEKEKYCINDVDVLAFVMKEYDTILFDKFQMSPWFNATAPSFVHKLILRHLSNTHLADLPPPSDHLRFDAVNNLALQEMWAVLQPEEYSFCRGSLRGGRTDIKYVHYKLTEEQIAMGMIGTYPDIVSMYPHEQAVRDYPVGVPEIHVFDPYSYPCRKHRNEVQPGCDCDLYEKELNVNRRLRPIVTDYHGQPTLEDIHQHEFFGIVCASLDPPETFRYHGAVVKLDENTGKCIAALLPYDMNIMTSVDLQVALQFGFRLRKVHRYDKYARRPSLWRDILQDLYIEKMANSSPAPETHEERERLAEEYNTRFGLGMGDKIRDSYHRWGDNPAKKQTFKILLNSCWGKHAQRPIMQELKIFGSDDCHEIDVMFANCLNHLYIPDEMGSLGNRFYAKYTLNKAKADPNLHGTYLPAAVFVPSYGRQRLMEQMAKLGDRVLMHDTDSIIYLKKPGEYEIPTGNVWGDWATEKFDSENGGIVEFVGLCPKTYALKAANGKTMIKCKGFSTKYYTRDVLNFDVMAAFVESWKACQDKETWTSDVVKVPQTTFVYRMGKNMVTWKYLKDFVFKPEDLKGHLMHDGQLLPFGSENYIDQLPVEYRDELALLLPPILPTLQ